VTGFPEFPNTSWLSIAGGGCDLTRVGAGEEEARKVVAGEASRCGEDK
jgi:hypothetical protein